MTFKKVEESLLVFSGDLEAVLSVWLLENTAILLFFYGAHKVRDSSTSNVVQKMLFILFEKKQIELPSVLTVRGGWNDTPNVSEVDRLC